MGTKNKIKDGSNMVFIVGSPRSGTTWLQNMISEMPDVVSGAETELFTHYVKKMYESWENQQDLKRMSGRGQMGLPYYFDQKYFDKSVKAFTDRVLGNMIGDSKMLLEKTPSHALVIDRIYKLYPKAKFIHIIRDPRDVVASMTAASMSWGKKWAPAGVISAARLWVLHVKNADNSLKKIPEELWVNIKYEDLTEDTVNSVIKLCDFMDIKKDDKKIKSIVEKYAFDKMKRKRIRGFDERKEPVGFYRKGEVGGWKQDLNFFQKLLLKVYLKKYLIRFGYI